MTVVVTLRSVVGGAAKVSLVCKRSLGESPLQPQEASTIRVDTQGFLYLGTIDCEPVTIEILLECNRQRMSVWVSLLNDKRRALEPEGLRRATAFE